MSSDERVPLNDLDSESADCGRWIRDPCAVDLSDHTLGSAQYADSLYEKASAIQDDNFRRAQHYRQQADTFLSSL